MQINSTVPNFANGVSNGVKPVDNTRSNVEQSAELAKIDNDSTAAASQRLDISQESLNLVRESYNSAFVNNSAVNQQSPSNNRSQYDQPSAQNQSAISAYTDVDNINQRENIQQVFGVDLLA